MNAQQIRDAVAADSALQTLATAGNHQRIAELLSERQPNTTRSLRVEEVFDVLFANGDYVTLKQAQLGGDGRAVMAFAALSDAKTIGPGTVNLSMAATALMLDGLQSAPALITQASRDALAAASVARPPAITHEAVTSALKGD